MDLPRGFELEDIVYDPQPGIPYRGPVYTDGAHFLNRRFDGVFWCGRTVWPHPDMLDYLQMNTGFDGDWWLLEDKRKSKKCARCKSAEKAYRDEQAFIRAREAVGKSVITDMSDEILEIHPDALPRFAAYWRSTVEQQ